MYALNLDEEYRILSATDDQYAPPEQPRVEDLPDGDIADYKFIDGGYTYSPLPKPERPEDPHILERLTQVEADTVYISMMSDIDDDSTHIDHFEMVKSYYDNKLWSKKRVYNSVNKRWISAEQYEEITGEPYIPINVATN